MKKSALLMLLVVFLLASVQVTAVGYELANFSETKIEYQEEVTGLFLPGETLAVFTVVPYKPEAVCQNSVLTDTGLEVVNRDAAIPNFTTGIFKLLNGVAGRSLLVAGGT